MEADQGHQNCRYIVTSDKAESIKQSEEPESIRVQVGRECSEMDRVVKRELGSERADVLSQMNVAMQKRSTQPSACVAFS